MAVNLCSSAGGGIPINGVLPINSAEVKLTTSNGMVMLRSGNVETNLIDYPDALIVPFISPTGSSFAIGNGETAPMGVAVDNNFVYVVGITTDRIWIYDKTMIVGMQNKKIDLDSGLTIYTRIK